LVGLAGLFWPPVGEWLPRLTPFPNFAALTPLNLLATAGILLWMQAAWTRPQAAWVAAALLLGFGIEALGVHTGAVFGEYAYGAALGWKWAEVPLLIGVNWMVLAYANSHLWARLRQPIWAKALLAGTSMVLLDVLIEPAAMHWDFWQWTGNQVPAQNYVAWWGFSCLFCAGWLAVFPPSTRNRVSLHVLGAQWTFFAVNNILI
jgi:putative membrane protein